MDQTGLRVFPLTHQFWLLTKYIQVIDEILNRAGKMDGKRSLHRFLWRLSHHGGDMLPMETFLHCNPHLTVCLPSVTSRLCSPWVPSTTSCRSLLLLWLLSTSRFLQDATAYHWRWMPFHLPLDFTLPPSCNRGAMWKILWATSSC